MLAPRVGRSPMFANVGARWVSRRQTGSWPGMKQEQKGRKKRRGTVGIANEIHVFASFSWRRDASTRLLRYASRLLCAPKQPTERTRCIYSSGSADSSLFRASTDQFRPDAFFSFFLYFFFFSNAPANISFHPLAFLLSPRNTFRPLLLLRRPLLSPFFFSKPFSTSTFCFFVAVLFLFSPQPLLYSEGKVQLQLSENR